MDPISVAASIITILTTAGTLLHALEQVRSRLTSNNELILLMNSVTDLQATLIIARDCANELESNPASAAQRSYQELHGCVRRLQEALDQLIDFAWVKLLRNGKGLPFLSLNDGKTKKLLELRESITRSHRNLQTVLLSANLRFTPSLFAAVQGAVITENDHYIKMSARLEHLITQIASIQNTDRRTPTNNESVRTEYDVSTPPIQPSMSNQAIPETRPTLPAQQVHITTVIPLKQCEPSCICQCHVRTYYKSPQWLSAVMGTLFYSSTNNAGLGLRPCNSKRCCRSHTSSSIRLTYHFPAWMIRTALVYSTWNNLSGTNSSWMIRMPRVIQKTNQCHFHMRKGDENHMKQLLQRKEISPWDVDSEGFSILQMALTWSQLGICALLLTAGADWQQKDRDGNCPADLAWKKILMSEFTDTEAVILRELIGPEDCYDLQLTSVHRIIVGLSNASLQDQLDLDPSLVNQTDWTGMSPLMWAASRGNSVAVQVLLSNSADVHLRNEKTSVLHFAASSGSYECVKFLLDAGADPNARDQDDNTPIFNAVHHPLPQTKMERVVSTLRDYGANLNISNKFGTTPILVAVVCRNPKGIEALVNSGCDPNAPIRVVDTALSLAVSLNEHECVKILVKLGAHLCWTAPTQEKRGIFKYAAVYATSDTIRALATSDASAVPYRRGEVMSIFHAYNPPGVYQSTQEGFISPRDAKLAALEALLAKKGIEIDPITVQWTIGLDELSDDGGSDTDDDIGFEDAIEYFGHS